MRPMRLIICCLAICFAFLGPDRLLAKSYAHAARARVVAEASILEEFSPSQTFEPPAFSHAGGFYTAAFQLTLSTPQADVSIYYTLDGSEPTTNTLLYSGPISVTSRAGDPNNLSLIRTTIPEMEEVTWNEPSEEIFKATIIRARVIRDDGAVSPIATHSYFVDPAGAERYSLPVISLVSDADNFFDPDVGIYIPGNGYDGIDPDSANFAQSGREWERPVHLEFFGEGGTRASAQDAGVRINGSYSRNLQSKSLRFYARSDYGPSRFNLQLFPDRPFTNYKTFLLRNAGNDWGSAHFRDGLVHRLVDHLSLDVQAFQPVVVFLNGEYWGILGMRERQDNNYLETHYGIPTDAVDMLEMPSEVSEGDFIHYQAMVDYIKENGVSAPEHYAYIQRQMDVDNFIDYNIVEIFSANIDWPHTNVENWRYRVDAFDPYAPYGFDGRWRWFLKDLDFGFGRTSSGHNTLRWATSPDGNTYGEWSTRTLRFLLENESFRHTFISRFADLLNTTFVPERIVATVDEIAGSLAPEMPEHIRRHGHPESMADWEQSVVEVRQFAQSRTERQRQHIVDFFTLGGTATVELNVSSPDAGAIRINSLYIDDRTAGITADAYPWQGIYFQDVPVTVTAIPRLGYRFAGWEGLNDDQLAGAESVELLLTGNLNLTAHFEAAPDRVRSHLPLIPR